ncbi:hypothetical protein Mgra_00009778 [Meloidogyne graminicola]|uniref:Uncharacterized protein n=1 Tax=Meloidogyne graminicola TaxID=189291 RepID=A0A8S9ZBG5_9BILA|nr:hypothetical protein Mgra_00009778 [Meloidogyne graminicola]
MEQNDEIRQIGFSKQSILCSVPEGSECLEVQSPPTIRRPTTLNVFSQEDNHFIEQKTTTKLNSSVFTEYRDTKPSYLKYSRDDIEEEIMMILIKIVVIVVQAKRKDLLLKIK